MLKHQLQTYGHLPAPLTARRRHFHALPLSLRQLSLMNMADITLYCSLGGLLHLHLGNDMCMTLSHLLRSNNDNTHLGHTIGFNPPSSSELSSILFPFWHIGLTPLVEHRTNGSFLRPSSCLDAFGTARHRHDILTAKQALNHLTFLLTGTFLLFLD